MICIICNFITPMYIIIYCKKSNIYQCPDYSLIFYYIVMLGYLYWLHNLKMIHVYDNET